MRLTKLHHDAAELIRRGCCELEVANELGVPKKTIKLWKDDLDFIGLVFPKQEHSPRKRNRPRRMFSFEVEKPLKVNDRVQDIRNLTRVGTIVDITSGPVGANVAVCWDALKNLGDVSGYYYPEELRHNDGYPF